MDHPGGHHDVESLPLLDAIVCEGPAHPEHPLNEITVIDDALNLSTSTDARKQQKSSETHPSISPCKHACMPDSSQDCEDTHLLAVRDACGISSSSMDTRAVCDEAASIQNARGAIQRPSTSDGPLICRFCHEEDCARGDRLIAPCLCMGTVKYVHVSCLAKWRSYSPSQSQKCGSCQLEYRMRLTDKPWKRALRRRFVLPVLLVPLWVGIASLLGFAPLIHSCDNFGWQLLNGEVLLGVIGLVIAGYELLSWRTATEALAGNHGMGRGWRILRLLAWYMWRVYILACAGLIVFLGTYPWFFKAVVALFGIGWMQMKLVRLAAGSLSQPTREVLELGDSERMELLQRRREQEEARKREEARQRELGEQEEAAQQLGQEQQQGCTLGEDGIEPQQVVEAGQPGSTLQDDSHSQTVVSQQQGGLEILVDGNHGENMHEARLAEQGPCEQMEHSIAVDAGEAEVTGQQHEHAEELGASDGRMTTSAPGPSPDIEGRKHEQGA